MNRNNGANTVRHHGDINEALGYPQGTLIAHAFVKSWEEGSQHLHPVPLAEADQYLNFAPLAFPGSGNNAGEMAVMFEPLRGSYEYLERVGVHQRGADERFFFLEKEKGTSAPDGDVEFHFMDIIRRNIGYYRERFGKLGFLPIFPSRHSEIIAELTGMELLNSEKAGYGANNKASLRLNADKYGYQVTEGLQYERLNNGEMVGLYNNVLDNIEGYIAAGKDVWVKYPTGSGGDLVVPLRHAKLKDKGSREIRQQAKDALVKIAYNVLLSRVGKGSIAVPSFEEVMKVLEVGGLVVETGLEGNFKNYNVQGVVGRNGEFTEVNMSEQLTSPEGAYLGNMVRPVEEYSEKTRVAVWQAMRQLSEYLHKEVGANMLFGADILVDENDVATVIDLNGRFNGSTSQKLIAAHLDVPYSLNVNINLPFVPETFQEILDCLGADILFDGRKEFGVLPKLPRRGTRVVKVDILGQDPSDIEKVRMAMTRRGVQL
ncbi:hypothetical protein CVV38_02140 [Candidatus Peregrinibacteria bacterium HGW-Peregrinibacteria-1]|jgi:hypothetical protein|nr:MAG: hypothetical protein CVV38_02140 [Candidatus Peregrinibacteria bacterium HGW-Peregrinibacteria-1]